MRGIFITGTDTNIGKTYVSAHLVKAWNADYWKPVQCGDLDRSDAMTVRDLLGGDYKGTIHPERYRFQAPKSPHIASAMEGVRIQLEDFVLPQSEKTILVEGAGGCLAPLNEEHAVIDLAVHLNLPVVLVTQSYLGAYNHTLSSIEVIRSRGLQIHGLVLNKGDDPEFREFVSRKTRLEFLTVIP